MRVLNVCVSWTVIWLVCRRRWLCLPGSSNAKWNCCLAQAATLPRPCPRVLYPLRDVAHLQLTHSQTHTHTHCLHTQLCESWKQLRCKGDTTVISTFKWQSFCSTLTPAPQQPNPAWTMWNQRALWFKYVCTWEAQKVFIVTWYTLEEGVQDLKKFK